MEGAATTVYAQGGKGNSRLVAWEGERTVTFTMEDALISPEGFMILSGAGLIEASKGSNQKVYQHMTETIDMSEITVESGESDYIKIPVSEAPYLPQDGNGNFAYVMFVKDGEIISEPYIPVQGDEATAEGNFLCVMPSHDCYDEAGTQAGAYQAAGKIDDLGLLTTNSNGDKILNSATFDSVLVDYYTVHEEDGTQQIEITADKFGGNYYLEASTLFRNQNGVDMPAEFIIPNCKIQSNFTFTMASSGDPSTFTFTMDAFPDYTRFDRSKKVLAAIQIIKSTSETADHRHATKHDATDFEW